MPMIHVHYQAGSLSAERKTALAEHLTRILIEIEGGPAADGPKARSIAWVMFFEVPEGSWAIGGAFDDTYVSPPGKFLVNVQVPEGALSKARKLAVHHRVDAALFEAFGIAPPVDPTDRLPSVFVQITEWPEGNMGARGRTYGLADIGEYTGAGNPEVHEHSKRYLIARAKLRAGAGFPE